MIPEERIERAINWLTDNAEAAAAARAEREYLDNYTRSLKAEIMREHGGMAINAQEREAYSDARYKLHLEALREAIERDELYRWRKVAADVLIEVWRTEQANLRGKA